jgi:AcrR family transcriptional regulator
MARPRSEDRRNAILTAATELIAEQGLGAPTAAIAKRAGVPHGSIFTYFTTKTDLLNVLYVDLSRELTDTVLATMPAGDDVRAQFHHLWESWTSWGAANLSKRRVPTLLNVSDLVTEENRNTAYDYAEAVYELFRRASAGGALREAPTRYIGGLVHGLVETTMDFIVRNPRKAKKFREAGFAAAWRMLH